MENCLPHKCVQKNESKNGILSFKNHCSYSFLLRCFTISILSRKWRKKWKINYLNRKVDLVERYMDTERLLILVLGWTTQLSWSSVSVSESSLDRISDLPLVAYSFRLFVKMAEITPLPVSMPLCNVIL